MNTDTEKLLRQLEQATSHSPLDDCELDAETRLLREGWLALDRVLQAPEKYALIQPAALQRTKSRRLAPTWIMTVSLLLLVTTICGSFVVSSAIPIQRMKIPIAQVGADNGADFSASGHSSMNSVDQFNADLAWDDSFDHRLAAASLAIRQAVEGREIRDWHFLQDELLEINDELTRSSL